MRNSVRTIVLWVVLMVLFIAFYQIFNGPPAGDEPPTNWSSTFFLLLPIVFVVLFAWFYFAAKKRQNPMMEGVRLLSGGRYTQALEQFELYRKAQPQQAVGAYNCGVTRLLLWKVESALADLQAAQQLGADAVEELKVMLPEQLALALALLGRAAEARQVLAELPKDSEAASPALASAILLAREGNWAAARARVSTLQVKRMGCTTGALARTLEALCIEQLTQEQRHVDRVALFGEASPDELEKHWPELVAFVKRAPAW